jgi:hypothetical protein
MSQNDTKQQTNRYSTNKLAVTFFSASTQEEEEEDGRSAANMNTIYLSSKVRWYSQQQQQQGSCWFCDSKQKNGKKKLICYKAPWLSPLMKIQTSVGWVGTSMEPAGYTIVLLSQYRNNTFTISTTNFAEYLYFEILTLAPEFLILKFLVGDDHAN